MPYPGAAMKKPLSERKLAANRANARKSRGPKTPEGKRAVRNNALKHGLYAATCAVLLPVDDPEDFQASYHQWHRLFTPRDYEEFALLDLLVAAHFRLTRQLRIERGIYMQDLELQDMLRAKGNPMPPDHTDPASGVAYAFRGLASISESNRQIVRLERSFLKYLDQIKKLHQRPDSEITVPLSDDLRQPPPLQKLKPFVLHPRGSRPEPKNEGTIPNSSPGSNGSQARSPDSPSPVSPQNPTPKEPNQR